MSGAIRVALLSAGLCLGPGSLAAQRAPGAGPADALQRFEHWIGSWSGTGWSVDATGGRSDFALSETVALRVGGTVLLVEGRGVAATGNGSATVTHDGLVLVYYDATTGSYHWHGHEIGRAPMDAEVRFLDGGFAWELAAGGATVRFTLLVDQQRWDEVGAVSADGTHWTTIMEMHLVRR